MTPLGLGLRSGFNRGGVSNESAPDIERDGLLFNLDANDIGSLYNSPSAGIYTKATVGQVVNKIICSVNGTNKDLTTINPANGTVLAVDANGKYRLDCASATGFAMTIADMPSIISLDEKLIVYTCYLTGQGNQKLYFGKAEPASSSMATAGTTVWLSSTNGIALKATFLNKLCIALNNTATAGNVYGLLNNVTVSTNGTLVTTTLTGIGNPAYTDRGNGYVYGVQIYGLKSLAQAKAIVQKAMIYYGLVTP